MRTLTYPYKPARPPCLVLKKMKMKRKNNGNSSLAHRIRAFDKNNLSFEKKQSRTAQVKPSARVLLHCRQETTVDFHAERLSRKNAGKDTPRDVLRYAAPKLRLTGTCRRKLRKPSASCDGGLEKLATCC